MGQTAPQNQRQIPIGKFYKRFGLAGAVEQANEELGGEAIATGTSSAKTDIPA
ncbi:MAG: hypothetical protein HC832_05535 [Leptolyngbyaceae cyanobacterium RM1_405_57]|nr:hypothetical protein [Leptolyngbyaceae cyanobacterium RM1_405_57]